MFCRTLLLLLSALLVLLTLAAAQPPQSIADVRITAISGCVDVGSVTVNCSVATTTLRIQTAAGFPATTIWATRPLYTQAHLGNYEYFVTTAAWLDPLDSTNTSVYVNVTANSYYPHITDTLISVSFIDYYTPGQPTSPPFAGFSYRFEGPPTLTAIGGCEGSGLSTLNCVPDSSIIELWGSGLLWYASGSYYLGKEINIGDQSTTLFNDLRVVNDSYATLPLALTYGTLLKPQHYAGVLLPLSFTSIAFGRSGQTDYSYTTNQLQISFIPLPAPVILQWYVLPCCVPSHTARLDHCCCLHLHNGLTACCALLCGVWSGLSPTVMRPTPTTSPPTPAACPASAQLPCTVTIWSAHDSTTALQSADATQRAHLSHPTAHTHPAPCVLLLATASTT